MKQTCNQEEVAPVLIVGGGVAGLSAALFLAARGVRAVLVERHAGSSPHPRAIGFTTRTLELFRAAGLAASIPTVPFGDGRPRRVTVESLAGKWSPEAPWTPGRALSPLEASRPQDGYSPCSGAAIAQDRLEPILRAAAIERGADLRMSTRLLSFEQDELGVAARLRRADGTEYFLRADYLVAADGHASPIRGALGIGRSGHGFMHVVRSVLFRADLDQYLTSGISQFELNQPDLKGMLTTYRDGRWLLMFKDDQERDEATLQRLVRRAIGREDVPIEIITTGRWELSALIADRFSSGRVFLVGDAAHTLPPARGGYGANTGIEDSANLAWKLAAVISGGARRDLLDTYEEERRPIAWLRHGQIFARPDYAAVATEEEKRVPVIDDEAMELGQLYRSSAIIGAGAALPPALRPEQWAGQPGTRAPHLWLYVGGRQISTLDLFHDGWALVAEDRRWFSALHVASRRVGMPVRAVRVGRTSADLGSDGTNQRDAVDVVGVEGDAASDDAAFRGRVRAAFGVSSTGASLIRPDGYVAWRSEAAAADLEEALVAALQQSARVG